MTARHTPGPWMVWTEDGFEIFPSPQGMRIATVHKEADARLIAAAPELLEAMIDCCRALEVANATGELAVVNAAIAKATGATA